MSTRAHLARTWLAVAAALTILGSPLEMGAASAAPVKADADVQAPANLLSTSSVGDPSCDQATSPSVVGAANGTKAGPGLLGDDNGPTLLGFLGDLGGGAFQYAEDDGLGWALSLMGVQQPGLDAAQISSELSNISTQVSALSQQESDDCSAVLDALKALDNEVDLRAYSDQVVQMDQYVGDVQAYQQDFDDIVEALQENGGHVGELSSELKDDLEAMVSGGNDGLQWDIAQISGAEGGGSAAADNMAQLFSKVLTDELGYDPYQTHIFPAAFVDAAYAQIGYYAGVVDKAAYLYANAAHLSFNDGGYHHPSDPGSVVALVNQAQSDLHSWSVAFSDGPSGGGTPKWVSQGNDQAIGGPIPDDTVLDYRVQGHPMLWTDSPVALNGYPSNPTPYYCATTAQFCYGDIFDARSIVPLTPGRIASSSLVLPSPEPLSTMIAEDAHDGLSGWRVPTTADWQDLEAGATGGLSTWGPAHQLDMFAAQAITSHYGGTDSSQTVIAPVLVDTGAGDGPYGVLTGYPGPNALVLEQPSFGGSGQNDIAGRLFLVLDYQPATDPAPFPTSTVSAPPPGSRLAHSSNPAAAPQSRPERPLGGSTPVPVPGPTIFSTPSACSSANSYTVPDGVAALQVKASGGAGAAATVHGATNAAGGAGAVVSETIPVTPGDTLYVQVGGAAHGATGGVAGGGNGGTTDSLYSGDTSGGGGGASGVSSTPDCSHWLVVAGGGGGAGSSLELRLHDETSLNGGRGGDACAMTGTSCSAAAAGTKASSPQYDDGLGSPGQAGYPAPANQAGTGGTNPNSSPAGSGSAGGRLTGGAGGNAKASTQGGGGGGGGAGYYGGGGGGGAGFDAAGGGGAGGASFAISGGSGISYGLGTAGQNGSVTITPIAKARPAISLSAASTDVTWGQPVALTATLPADATGTVGFYDDVNGGCEDSATPGAA
ncbi:MAG TPA: hypothetical protein VMF65_24665, partial [Acidimicrobiales bacterium]|nr:hypothetical protein [Acidimicrobiales bacterium]